MATELELIRCPKGCDPTFAQYVTWEGTDVRIIDEHTHYDPATFTTRKDYTLHLRCADCACHYTAALIPRETKQAFDQHLKDVEGLILADIKELERENFNQVKTLLEENRGLAG